MSRSVANGRSVAGFTLSRVGDPEKKATKSRGDGLGGEQRTADDQEPSDLGGEQRRQMVRGWAKKAGTDPHSLSVARTVWLS